MREKNNQLCGIVIARGAPRISHLFFDDDCVLFAKATCQQSSGIVNILRVYGEASGEQVKFAKSEISFSDNAGVISRSTIQQIVGIREVDKHEKYLGLPTMICRSKKVIFETLKEHV